ncbi:NFX1-type zinc finger-containing protein 1-like [Styela clava]
MDDYGYYELNYSTGVQESHTVRSSTSNRSRNRTRRTPTRVPTSAVPRVGFQIHSGGTSHRAGSVPPNMRMSGMNNQFAKSTRQTNANPFRATHHYPGMQTAGNSRPNTSDLSGKFAKSVSMGPRTNHPRSRTPSVPRHPQTQTAFRNQNQKSSTNRDGNARPRFIGYKKLERMLETFEPREIVLSLALDSSELEELLSSQMGNGMIQMILKVCGKMSETDDLREHVTKILNLLAKHQFLTKAYTFIHGFLKESSRGEDNRMIHLQNCLRLMANFLTVLPASTEDEVGLALTILDIVIDRLGLAVIKEDEYYKEVKTLLKNIQEKETIKVERSTRKREMQLDDAHLLAPPDDFRHIPVIPRPEDLREDAEPFVRCNLIGGAYQDMDHYLDVQYRLLREDYIRPLREGIALISENLAVGGGSNRNVKVYTDVKIEFVKPSRKGVLHRLHFSTESLQKIRWRNTKRLLQGNLLCLSYDNFKDHILFAVVADRNPEDLEQGYIWVEFVREDKKQDEASQLDHGLEMESEIGSRIDFHLHHTMVESEAYFEAYKHVLEALKEMRRIPLERYIVKCSSDVHAPEYLRPSVAGKNVSYGIQVTAGTASVRVLDEKWPTSEQLSLDGTQKEALKLALTKELAIIQGPPGTGKTHVGLEIMKVLLTNKSKWCHGRSMLRKPKESKINSPILVVCYTNHALDQFVEGIAKFCGGTKSIIRVGGRCANEAIKQFSLRSARDRKKAKGRKGMVGAAIGKVFRQMKEFEETFQDNINRLEYSLRVVLNLDSLKQVDDNRHLRQLQPNSYEGLLHWLGVDIAPPEKQNSGNRARTTGEENFEMMEEADVEEEADYELDRRILEEDYMDDYMETKRKKQQKNAYASMDSAKFESLKAFIPTVDENGFQLPSEVVKKAVKNLKEAQSKTSIMSDAEVFSVRDIYQLKLHDKWRLYRTWASRWRDNYRKDSHNGLEEYARLLRELKDLRDLEDGEILKEADVIAITTTGAAKYRNMIQKLDCKIVVIEEAAEVLEAHIVTTMPKATNHLILIGDHQQLRPSPTVYELAKKYSLDTSLFERLVKTNIPFVTLSLQHRMRPSIADLIRPEIYKSLSDHESVFGRAQIDGVEKSLYFISHQVPEESVQDGKSKKNLHEAKFLSKLCEYLLLQGYKPEQITILTMYTGQLFAFRNSMSSKSRGVRVTAVDNFQGEENDIILLSLVRSNFEGKIGFLSIDNRICVALSRARNALYCIGNMTLLKAKSGMWNNIVTKLMKNNNVGESLRLQCQNHPDRYTVVRAAEDFLQVAEGGCTLSCTYQLPCGHVCPRRCHPGDHSDAKCMKKCTKTVCDLGHKCKKKCFQDCGKCMELILKDLPCGHQTKAQCYLPAERVVCRVKITEKLSCGHEITVDCHLAGTKSVADCNEKCSTFLPCGHFCGGTCFKCFQGRLHIPCQQKCSKMLWCEHKCTSLCSPSCLPCIFPCTNYCDHAACKLSCSQPCIPCQEPCTWECQHYKCRHLCGELCDRPRCNMPCEKKLKCGHDCIGICGEKCIDVCKFCNEKKYKNLLPASDGDVEPRFVELDGCGHIFNVHYLDNLMDSFDEAFPIKHKKCPKCSKAIRWNQRYGNVIKRKLRDINAVKAKIKESGAVDPSKLHLLKVNSVQQSTKITSAFPFLGQALAKSIKNSLDHPINNILLILERKLNNLEILSILKTFLTKEVKGTENTSKQMKDIEQDIKNIANWIILPRSTWSSHESENLDAELKRIELSVRFLKIYGEIKGEVLSDKPTIASVLRRAKSQLFDIAESMTKARRDAIDGLIHKMNIYLKISDDSLSDISRLNEDSMFEATEQNVHNEWFRTLDGDVGFSLLL